MRNLLIVCNPGRVDAVVAAVELQQNLASTFGIYTISDVNIPGVIRSTIAELPEIEAAVVLGGDGTMLRAAEVAHERDILKGTRDATLGCCMRVHVMPMLAAVNDFTRFDTMFSSASFDEAIQPGAKNFDFNLQQYSITDERKQTVSFSDPYYTTNQAIVGYADSAAASATTVAELQGLKFGVQSGTTSLEFLNTVVMPTNEPYVYDDNAAAKAALEAKQIDAIVVDLPTAFYISAVEIEGTKVIGQFPAGEGTVADQFGLVFDLDNPLVECVNVALAALKESGELATIEQTWLSDKTSAPVISLG